MHVGIVIPSLHGGGAEFATRQWADGLTAAGHTVTVFAYDRAQPEVALPDGVTVRHFNSSLGPLRHLLLPGWLRRTVLASRPDVVLSLMTYSNVMALIALTTPSAASVPLVISERNMPSIETAAGRRRDRLIVRAGHLLYRRASAALAISHPVAAELVSAFHVPSERVFVVPNPVVSSAPGTRRARAHDGAGMHVTFVGRFVSQKRPELFLEVIAELAGRGTDVRATMIGDGPLREPVERKAREQGLAVAFPGWREPWWEHAGATDCLLLTAAYEGFGNVLVEAAAAGIPSVATSRALGVADAIVAGVTGELSMTDEPADYADAVTRAHALELAAAGAPAPWLARFSTTTSTTALLEVFGSVLHKHS